MLNAIGAVATVMAAAASPQPLDFTKGMNYDSSKLIDEIVKPILDQKYPAPDPGALDEKIENFKIDNFIKLIQDDNKLGRDLFNKWKTIFNVNPSINISDGIRKLLTPTVVKKWVVDGTANGVNAVDYIENTLFDFIDKGMDAILNAATPLIDWNSIQTQINNKIKTVLDTFKLDSSDRSDGVNTLNSLGLKAKAYLEGIVKNADPLVTGEPYLDLDKTKISEELDKQIEKDYRDEALMNKLASSSLDKAKLELASIEGNIFSSKISDRSFEVLEKMGQQSEPWKLYAAIFGKKGNELETWFNKWKDIIDVSETLDKTSNTNFRIRFNLSIKDGFIALAKDPSDPNGKDIKLKSTSVQSQTFTSKYISIGAFKYSTGDLRDELSTISNQLSSHGTILETDFAKLKSTNPGLTGITLAQMESLAPTELGNLKNIIDKLKLEYDKPEWGGINGNSQLEVTFDIKETIENGKEHLEVIPKIKDTGIGSLASIDTTGLDPADAIKIEGITKDFDKDHIEEDMPSFKVQLTTELWNVVSRIYSYFQSNPPENKDIYKSRFNSNSDGDLLNLDDIREIFSKNKNKLDDLLASITAKHGTRFKISFSIKHIDALGMVVNYKVEDTSDGDVKDSTIKGDELSNIKVIFSTHASPYERYKADLMGLAINPDARFDTMDHAKSFDGKTIPIAGVPKIIVGIDKLVDDASKEKEPITISTLGELRWNVQDNILQMKFTLEHDVNGISESEDIWKTVSGKFVDLSFIKEKIQEIEEIKTTAEENIEGMKLPNTQEELLLGGIIAATEAFKNNALNDPGITLEKLKEFKDTFQEMIVNISSQAAIFKNDMVYDMLEKIFNGHIPKGIEDLFNKYSDRFMDIIQNHPELLKNPDELKKFFEFVKEMDVSTFLNATKTMEKDTKIAIATLGGILGLGGALGAANAVKIGTTNNKLSKLNGRGKNIRIKSSKKLAFISALIGIASIAGSVGAFLYLFIAQGGF